MNDKIVADTIAERGKVYGDPKDSHTNIGLAWTGLIQQHYGIKFDHPIPAFVVALMLVQFKASRSAKVYHADNFIDAHAYVKFADDFQSADIVKDCIAKAKVQTEELLRNDPRMNHQS